MLMDRAAIEQAVNFPAYAVKFRNELETESNHAAVLFCQTLTKCYLMHLWTGKHSLANFASVASPERREVLPLTSAPVGEDLNKAWELAELLAVDASGMMLYATVMERAAVKCEQEGASKWPLSGITLAERNDKMLSTENLQNLTLPRYAELLSDARILKIARLSSADEAKDIVKSIQASFFTGLHTTVQAYTRDIDNELADEGQRVRFLDGIKNRPHQFDVLEMAFHEADVGSPGSTDGDKDYAFGTGFFYSLLGKASLEWNPKPSKLQELRDCEEYLGLMAASVYAYSGSLPAHCALADDVYTARLAPSFKGIVDKEISSIDPLDTRQFLLGVKMAVEYLCNHGTKHIREDRHFKHVLEWLREKGLVG